MYSGRLISLTSFAAVLLATALLAGARGRGAEEDSEPFPIRRVLLPAERVAAEMQRARVGVLKQMPLAEFEDLVSRASKTAAAFRTEPRIITAKYRARLEATDLVGSLDWKVYNPGPAARLLRLDPFNLALQKTPTFENRPALAGDFDGKKPALLLDEPGIRTVSADWSAHGEVNPEGIRFDLGMPPATIATLDLYLPVDYAVVQSPDGYTVTGPTPAETNDRQLWHIGFACDRPLRLRIRGPDNHTSESLVLTYKLATRQQLTPDAVETESTIEFDSSQNEVRELECESDPIIRIVDVHAGELEGWELIPTGPNTPAHVRVRFREPVRKGTLRIYGICPLNGRNAEIWTSPEVRLLNAVPREETLVLHVHPDVRFTDWRPGRYRQVKTAMEGDGTRVLSLIRGSLDSGLSSDSARPRARVTTTSVEYQARQIMWWQVQSRKSSLTCQLDYEALHGRLFQLPLELPAGWRVERVELTPPGLLRDWEVRQERGVATLFVDLQRPLQRRTKNGGAQNQTGRLTVRLTAEGPTLDWAFPDVVPRGARCREGSLAIDYDEQAYRARVEANAVSVETAEEGPWGNQKPDYYFSYFGEPVRGTVHLEPRDPRVALQCSSEVLLRSGRATLVTHVRLQPRTGSPDSVELLASIPTTGKWEWKAAQGDNPVRAFVPISGLEAAALALLGAGSPHAQAVPIPAALHSAAGIQRWRLVLDRPLRETVSLYATCDIPRSPDGQWEIPLLCAPPPDDAENDVTVFLAGLDLSRIETEGLREASGIESKGRESSGSPLRIYQYQGLPARLVLHGRAPGGEQTGDAVVSRAALTTYVERGGRQIHHYRFHLGNWRERVLPLYLPAGAELLAARIDGRWVARVPPTVPANGKVFVELPAGTATAERAAGRTEWRTYEIVYSLSGPPWHLWAEVPPPAPILPVAPVTFRRSWRLPSGVVPLNEELYRCLPSASRDQSARGTGLPFPLDGWRSSRNWVQSDSWESEQRLRLAQAAAALGPSPAGRETTLGELLDRLTSEHLAGEPLVVDAEAIRQAGTTAMTLPVTGFDRNALPWESFGLTYIPCRAAPALTTRRELEIWREAARLGHRPETTVLSASLEEAIADAASHGHDNSGRFQLTTEWLYGGNGVPNDDRADSLQAVLGELHAEYWTEWEPLAGTDFERPMIVVRREIFSGMALAAAGVLCLVFWRMPERGRLAVLLIWLAVAGLGYFWLPQPLRVLAWWPLLGGGAAALGWYLASTVGKSESAVAKAAQPIVPPAVVGLMLAITAGVWLSSRPGSRADEPAEPVVFLVREASADKYSVLAPPDLLDRLQLLARRADTPSAGAVLVGAEYEGKTIGGLVEFKAVFQVYCFGSGPVYLHLPLDGVQLDGETLVDGARVFPSAAKPPLTGYTLRIEKTTAPLHQVTLSFRTRIGAAGDEREAALTLPSVLGSRLTLDLPPGSRGPEAIAADMSNRGRQRTIQSPAGIRLESDLGRLTAQLRLRWSVDGGPRPAQVEAREWYLWDLRPSDMTLTALVNYSVTQGATSTLALHVPERLEVLSVKAGAAVGWSTARLKSWRVMGTKADRQLEMEFQNPVRGEVLSVVQFAPHGPLNTNEPLPIPLPRAARTSVGYLAYQLSDLEARIQAQGLTVLTVHEREQFAAQWKRDVDPRLPGLPTNAYSFDRAATGPPLLKLDLRFTPRNVQGDQQVTWRVGGNQAEFQAAIRLTAPDGELALVEWNVPAGVFIARISGDELSSWSQTGSRVQAWLDGPRRSAALLMTGWLNPPRPTPAGPVQFQLPCVRLLSATAVENSVRIKGMNGIELEELERSDLAPLPDSRPALSDPSYYSPQPSYSATFRLRQTPGPIEARALTLAELRGQNLAFTALVDLHVFPADARAVTIELRGWPNRDVRWDVLEGAAKARRLESTQETGWALDFPSGSSGRQRVKVSGSVPLEQVGAETPMPEVQIRGTTRVERWLGVVATGALRPYGARGIEASVNLPGAWADPVRRNAATYWRVNEDKWGLTLHPAQTGSQAPGVRLVLTEQECSVEDGQQWRFESTFWLYHEANTDLTVLFPSRSRLLGVAVDDARITPLQLAPDRALIPLPASAGSCKLQVRWTFDEHAPLERPRLQLPKLEGVDAAPGLWTVHVPAGYQIARNGERSNPGRGPSPVSAATLDLHRATCQQLLSTFLADRLRAGDTSMLSKLSAAQQHFYRACRYAEQHLAVGIGDKDTGPEGQLLSEWLKALRDRNYQLAREQGFDSLRAESELQAAKHRSALKSDNDAAAPATADSELAGNVGRRNPWPADYLPPRGRAFYWQGEAGSLPPHLVLIADHILGTRKAVGLSAVWLIVLIMVGLAAQFDGLRAWLRLFWPEQVVLLACIVWQAFGLNLLLVFLILLGVCGRVVFLLQMLARRLRRTTPAPPPAPVA